MRDPRKRRRYSIKVSIPTKPDTHECTTFRSDLEHRARTGGRRLIGFKHPDDQNHCGLMFELECDSCGYHSLHRFRRDLEISYPKIEFSEFLRIRAA